VFRSPSDIANKTRRLLLGLTLILAGQIAASRATFLAERLPKPPSLHLLPAKIGSWRATGEQYLDPAVLNYLKPNDYIMRIYENPEREIELTLLVAYFRSLKSSYGPHSPRVCLPGHGWLTKASATETIQIDGSARGMRANRYLMEKGKDEILVLYWYQNGRRIWAEEFRAKLYLLPDLVRYRRSDVSLIRIIAPTYEGMHEATFALCRDFAAAMLPALEERFSAPDDYR
jgi:EpsI family protein